MSDKSISISRANWQSFMAAEYIFRMISPGETFTTNFLLNNVGFKSPNSKAQTGIRMALDLLTENRNGKKNVAIMSTPPDQEIVYKLIDNETPILIEKNKDEGVVSINSKYFETHNNHESDYKISAHIEKQIDSLKSAIIPLNSYRINSAQVNSGFEQQFKQQVAEMTQDQRRQAMLILYNATDEQLTDALSVIELTRE